MGRALTDRDGPRRGRRVILAVFVVAAIVGGIVIGVAPPPRVPSQRAGFRPFWPDVRGAYHVHSNRSDGTGTFDDIARAAAAAGLQFVIVTDHGDGTRPPVPPSYRFGVMCIDAVEISTDEGHYVALGLGQTPYPLAGRAADVIEDVRRFGGFGIAAHPASPKPALRWQAWDAAFDGVEWLNADSEWRDEFWGSLGVALLTYAFRPTETLAGLLDRPESVLAQWDAVTGRRRVVALAGADAHARLGFRRATDPYEDRVIARLPTYETSFRTFANHVLLDGPLTGRAADDARQLLAAIRDGRTYTSIDGLAGLSALDARATSGSTVVRPGEYLDIEGDTVLAAQVAAPDGTTLAVWRDGVLLYERVATALRLDVGREPGAYRIEARLPNQRPARPVPWILTNPFYVGLRSAHAAHERPAPAPPVSERVAVSTAAWEAEASAGSTSVLAAGALDDGTPALEWAVALDADRREGRYAALRFPVDAGLAEADGVRLRIRSDRPRRIWLQIRAPGGPAGERWGSSIPVDETLQTIERRWADFRPLGAVSSGRPRLDAIDSLLLVVDSVNTAPGTRGTFWVPDLWLVR